MGGRRGPLALVAADGAAPVSPRAALLEEMLAGWRRQQQARRLSVRLIGERERLVRQFAAFTGCWPWQWTAAQAESWVSSGGWAHSTARSYQGALALLLKTLWFSVPAYQGPFIIRAKRLGHPGPVALGEGPTVAPLVVPPGPTLNGTGGWREAPGGLWVRTPGCYAWQVDGLTFSEIIIVHALVQ